MSETPTLLSLPPTTDPLDEAGGRALVEAWQASGLCPLNNLNGRAGVGIQRIPKKWVPDHRAFIDRKSATQRPWHSMVVQRLVRSVMMVVGNVRGKTAVQGLGREGDQVPPNLAASGTNESFDERVARWRLWRCEDDVTADRTEALLSWFDEDGITVHDDMGGSRQNLVVEVGEVPYAVGDPSAMSAVRDSEQADLTCCQPYGVEGMMADGAVANPYMFINHQAATR